MAIGEYINHYNAVRMSVLGTGNLNLTLYSLPDKDGNQVSQILVPVDMTNLGRRPSNSLADFKEDAAQLEIKTTEINEKFNISRIIIYRLPVDTSYPG